MAKGFITLRSSVDLEREEGDVSVDNIVSYFRDLQNPNGGTVVGLASGGQVYVMESVAEIRAKIEAAQAQDK